MNRTQWNSSLELKLAAIIDETPKTTVLLETCMHYYYDKLILYLVNWCTTWCSKRNYQEIASIIIWPILWCYTWVTNTPLWLTFGFGVAHVWFWYKLRERFCVQLITRTFRIWGLLLWRRIVHFCSPAQPCVEEFPLKL